MRKPLVLVEVAGGLVTGDRAFEDGKETYEHVDVVTMDYDVFDSDYIDSHTLEEMDNKITELRELAGDPRLPKRVKRALREEAERQDERWIDQLTTYRAGEWVDPD